MNGANAHICFGVALIFMNCVGRWWWCEFDPVNVQFVSTCLTVAVRLLTGVAGEGTTCESTQGN